MPVYPEIYLFHIGGPHGDFSYFDFWPPRKEVQVAASQPVSLLEAINAHGITRLAMPLGDIGAESALRTGTRMGHAATLARPLGGCRRIPVG